MSLWDTVLDLWQWSRQLFPVLGKLWFDYALSERILFLWPSVLCSSVWFYYFWKYIRKSSIAWFITSLIFWYNTYFLTLQTWHVTLATAFSMFGIIWLLYNQFLIKKSGKYLLYTILVFFIAFWYEPRAAYIIWWILFLYTLFRGITNNSNKWTIILLLCIWWLLFLAINIWRMLPLTESIGNVNNHDILTRWLFGSQYFNIVHALTLHHPWRDWVTNEAFVSKSIPMYFWLIPLFAWTSFVVQRKNFYMQFFWVVCLVWIFLSKQTALPWWFIYQYLFDHFPWFNAFREASKFYSIIAISYSVMIAWWVHRLSKQTQFRYWYYITISIITVLFLRNTRSYINWTIGTLFITKKVPEEYVKLNTFLQSQNKYWRVALIPWLTPRIHYDTKNPKISISTIINLYSINNNHPFQPFETTFNKAKKTFSDSQINDILDSLSIRYIILPLLDKNNNYNEYIHHAQESNSVLYWLQGITKEQKQFSIVIEAYNEYYKLLKNNPFLQEIDLWLSDWLRIFENQWYLPLITTQSWTIQYHRINPATIHLTINIVSWHDTVDIQFLENFHKGRTVFAWDWVINKSLLFYIPLLQKSSLFYMTHKEIYNYANQRTIDRKTIETAFPKESYIINDDGSITVHMILYFRPQSRLYVWAIVSWVTLLSICARLVRGQTKRKNLAIMNQNDTQ